EGGAPTFHHVAPDPKSPMVWRLVPAPDGRTVVSLNEDGYLEALAAGRAQIEVAYLGQRATTTVIISDDPPVEGKGSPDYETIDRGGQLQLAVKARFGTSLREWDMKRRATWSATDVGPETGVVSVDAEGLVRGRHVGLAELTATVAGVRASTQVMVVE